jgi:hypothetical protein
MEPTHHQRPGTTQLKHRMETLGAPRETADGKIDGIS